MQRPHHFGPLPHVRYRPELTHCPHRGAALIFSHAVWAKPVQFLTGPEYRTNLGYCCSNPAYPFPRAIYRSARAEARQVRGSGYGLEVIVRLGHLRFRQHHTRDELWRRLHSDLGLQLSERHVQNLLELYLAVLRASQADPRPGAGARRGRPRRHHRRHRRRAAGTRQ